MKQVSTFLTLSLLALFIIGCQSSEEEFKTNTYSAQEYNVLGSSLDLPEFPFKYSNGNLNHGIEVDHKGTFGRVLFYDTNLSADGKVSCASCHQQSKAFADDKAFSNGANGNITSRNSIALASFASFGRHYDPSIHGTEVPGLFWDERAGTIKEQLKQTINNPNEMGMELSEIVDLVNSKDYYRILHEKAYGSAQVAEDHVLEALEVFMNSIGSSTQNIESEIVSNLNYITGDSIVGNIKHEVGLRIFTDNCNGCHNLSLDLIEDRSNETLPTVANNGLSLAQNDLGVYEHTQDQQDVGKFKIPGLLNIGLTAPYMHDGRFATLEQVVEFYDSGINFSSNLDPALREGNHAKRMNLTDEEKTALVDFLKILTDENLTEEVKWSDPFL